MLNSVPESMRACLIEAAKLSAPGFKKKAEAAAGSELGSLGGSAGPLSFNISVDAGRAPPAAPASAVAAFAAAAGGAGGGGGLAGAESDPLLLMAGAMGSDPLLGPIPPLGAPPTTVPQAVDGQGATASGDAAAAQRGAAPGNQQQLLDLIRCVLCAGLRGSPTAVGLPEGAYPCRQH